MSRTLTRPMFRKGGMAQREKYMGGGIKAIRPRYMGGGMTGIMSGIQPDAGLTPRTGFKTGKSFEQIQEENRIKQEIKNKSPFLSPQQIEDRYKQYVQRLEESTMTMGIDEEGPGTFLERAQTDLTTAISPEGKEAFIADLTTKEKAKEQELISKGIIPADKSVFKDTSEIPDRGRGETEKPKKIIGTQDVTSDKDELQSYMDMFEAAAGSDPDESRRSKYLELAKFGANLLAQPGGDLIGAVGKAAAPSIGGLSKQMESDRDAKRQLRIAGVQAYLKDQDPGSIGKAVKDIMKSDPSLTMKEALTLAMQTGSATKGATKESRIQEYAEILLGSKGAPEDKRIARALAERIENSGLGFSNFEPLPENPVKDEYYYDTEGKLYKGTEDGVVELNVKK